MRSKYITSWIKPLEVLGSREEDPSQKHPNVPVLGEEYGHFQG